MQMKHSMITKSIYNITIANTISCYVVIGTLLTATAIPANLLHTVWTVDSLSSTVMRPKEVA